MRQKFAGFRQLRMIFSAPMRSTFSASRTVILVLSGLMLGGCITAPSVNADRGATGQMRKIALLSIPEPSEIPVANIGGAAAAFGLVGGLVQADINLGQAKDFAAYLKAKNLDVARHFEEELTLALRTAGYDVIVVSGQRPKVAADGKSDDYSGVHVDADAILSIWSRSFGYISPPNTTHYEPSGVVMVRLLDSKSKADLYFKTFVVGWKLPIKQSIYLETDPKFRYHSIDQFKATQDEAIQGIFEAERLISQHVKEDLAPPPRA
jgi:hypothetical protein